jgi:hypothetical protein
MNPIYIPSTNTIIREYSTRYVHPDTGEVYGREDYYNAQKLLEIGAIPVVDCDGIIPENPIQTGTTIVVEDGIATITKTWRSITEAELKEKQKQQHLDNIKDTEQTEISVRKIEDLYEILLNKELISEEDIPELVLSWINNRKEERNEITLLEEISGSD